MPAPIGIVNIDYLEEPAPAVCLSFLQDAVARHPRFWTIQDGTNAILELERFETQRTCRLWAKEQALNAEQQETLSGWLEDLPWDEQDTVTLYLRL